MLIWSQVKVLKHFSNIVLSDVAYFFFLFFFTNEAFDRIYKWITPKYIVTKWKYNKWILLSQELLKQESDPVAKW